MAYWFEFVCSIYMIVFNKISNFILIFKLIMILNKIKKNRKFCLRHTITKGERYWPNNFRGGGGGVKKSNLSKNIISCMY